jgi:cell division protease FtsH
VQPPDLKGRIQILHVHTRQAASPGVNVEVVAVRRPGLTGADLANLCNEAAICWPRRAAGPDRDFDHALDRVIAASSSAG